MALKKRSFGVTAEGQEVYLYTLENSNGMNAEVTNFGANLVNLLVPDAKAEVADVVLGFDDVEGYMVNGPFFGAVVGPSANRIGGAAFEIDGVNYTLAVNDGANNLHSDRALGYHKQIWDVEEGDNSITFTIKDTDGNMGFPGNKVLSLTYILDEENALTLKYHGTSDKKTILNPTNHTYFNLDGHKSGSIEGHTIQLKADFFTPTTPDSIPTGEIMAVKGTPMDLTEEKVIGQNIDANFDQLAWAGGYDHNWILNGWDGTLREFAVVTGPVSGRKMIAYTTLPGVQFYAGNFIVQEFGKDGAVYGKRNGLCLETQYYPNSINIPSFPSCVYGEGREYDSVTVYKFV